MFLASLVSVVLLAWAAALRAGSASLLRTPLVDALHDAAEGDRRAELVAELLEERARIQPSVSVVHAGLLVGAALTFAWAAVQTSEGPALVVVLAVFWAFSVLAAEVLPRWWGRRRPRTLAYRLAALLAQAVRLGSRAADLLEEEIGAEMLPDPGDEEEAREEEQEKEERELISSVLEFSDAIVREVMVPRTDMVTIPATATTDQALDLVIERGFSRVPVRGDGSDDVVGVIYAKDLLRLLDQNEGARPVTEVMRIPYFVPETKRVAGLLREMQANQVHMAVVVDEFGGIAGLVTIEDLLEELVGEIIDEFDTEEPMAVPQRDGSYLVDARMPVDELAGLVGVELPAGDWDTVGGLILGMAGRVPREGERFELDGIVLVSVRVQGRRVARVRVSQV